MDLLSQQNENCLIPAGGFEVLNPSVPVLISGDPVAGLFFFLSRLINLQINNYKSRLLPQLCEMNWLLLHRRFPAGIFFGYSSFSGLIRIDLIFRIVKKNFTRKRI